MNGEIVMIVLVALLVVLILILFLSVIRVFADYSCEANGSYNCKGEWVYDDYPYMEWRPKLKCLHCIKFRERKEWQERIEKDLQKQVSSKSNLRRF